ncbi:15487_t:CDS:1, partial [Gigaspora margarita]
CLHKARREVSTKQKHSYTELRSDLQKNKQIVLATNLDIQITELFCIYQFVNLLGANIVKLELVKLKIANENITLNYQLENKNKLQYYNFLV